MDDNNEQPPDEPIIIPTLASLNIEDIPTLDLQTTATANNDNYITSHHVDENTEALQKDDVSSAASPDEKLLTDEDQVLGEQSSVSIDAVFTEHGSTSGSEPDYTSDWEFSTDDEDEETTDDLVRRVTAHRGQPFENGHTRRHHLDSAESSSDIALDLAPLPLTPSPTIDIIFANEHFTVKRSEIAGWGGFAARDLKRGDKILVEKPLFTADSTTLFEEFEELSQPLREIALGLHANSSCKPGTPQIKAVWTTNCFSTGGGDEAGLFPIASRFNHSCHPKQNVNYHYNEIRNVLEMEVRADSVKAGEELTICYGILRKPVDLYFRYGFECRCGGCAGFSEDDLKDFW
ncbi:hypothetical protein ACHAP5_006776 [Fusarium lateritium]